MQRSDYDIVASTLRRHAFPDSDCAVALAALERIAKEAEAHAALAEIVDRYLAAAADLILSGDSQ